ncbi:hypothetical protein BXY41_11648 [Lacrimispora xylanisolvens]|uniref:Uncharacterized protein n=1 Tax=Lacrimispora xylanisolvens TaxID=384636 RepID=A0A2S6HJ66_9FIRM|nr:hypothetical protein [Hungatella xylanolytica]PPK77510.1 hypothetical protein BXY41_11648 [Hungatella xylanolytica]
MKWLSILKINVLILLALLISVMILIFYYYKIKKKYTNKEALCKSWKAIEIILKFNYNGTHNIDFNYLKMVIGKVFIPMSEKNAFWIDTKTIQLNNITYDSDKGSVGLKELILTKDKIEIVYDVHSKSTGVIDLVKTKGSTELTINNNT